MAGEPKCVFGGAGVSACHYGVKYIIFSQSEVDHSQVFMRCGKVWQRWFQIAYPETSTKLHRRPILGHPYR